MPANCSAAKQLPQFYKHEKADMYIWKYAYLLFLLNQVNCCSFLRGPACEQTGKWSSLKILPDKHRHRPRAQDKFVIDSGLLAFRVAVASVAVPEGINTQIPCTAVL